MGAAALAAVPSIGRALAPAPPPISSSAENWDVSWTKRISGKHRALFDVPEIESGYGVWRGSIWGSQYMDVLGAKPSEISTVIVLRHHGIALAMQQAFWDRYGIGKLKNVTHPVTEQPTDRNPALLSSARGEQPPTFDPFALDRAMSRGVIVLACNLALADCAGLIQSAEKVTSEVAHQKAREMLVPGVILQPSGVFATVLGQEAGCNYVRAS